MSAGRAETPEPWLRGPLEGVDPYLTPAQREAAAAEKNADLGLSAQKLAAEVAAAVERALAQMRATPRDKLLEPRAGGLSAPAGPTASRG